MTKLTSNNLGRDLGDHIRLLRTRDGLLQRELADFAGTDKETIGRIENNKTNVSLTTIKKVTDALGVELWEALRDCRRAAL